MPEEKSFWWQISKFFQKFYGDMRSFVLAAGKRMKNEFFFKNRLEVPHQKMVNDSVAKIGGENFARLGLGDHKANRLPGFVGSFLEFLFQFQEFALETEFDFRGIGCFSLSPATSVICFKEFLKSEVRSWRFDLHDGMGKIC